MYVNCSLDEDTVTVHIVHKHHTVENHFRFLYLTRKYSHQKQLTIISGVATLRATLLLPLFGHTMQNHH